jgi:hypothetical protein
LFIFCLDRFLFHYRSRLCVNGLPFIKFRWFLHYSLNDFECLSFQIRTFYRVQLWQSHWSTSAKDVDLIYIAVRCPPCHIVEVVLGSASWVCLLPQSCFVHLFELFLFVFFFFLFSDLFVNLLLQSISNRLLVIFFLFSQDRFFISALEDVSSEFKLEVDSVFHDFGSRLDGGEVHFGLHRVVVHALVI